MRRNRSFQATAARQAWRVQDPVVVVVVVERMALLASARVALVPREGTTGRQQSQGRAWRQRFRGRLYVR
jgi:hypothetical protein